MAYDTWMDARLQRILLDLRVPDIARAKVSALSGGITNENFLVASGPDRFVLRVCSKDGEALGIDRARERRCALIAAKLGLGAEPVAHSRKHRATLSRFIDGRPLTPPAAARPANLRRVVRSIKICHNGPAFPGTFSPFKTVRAYHALARRNGVALSREVDRALELMERIELTLGPCRDKRPCHNDLLAANLIDDGNTVRIIDWEYAAMGEPFFDLGNFAVNQKLGPEGLRLLLKEYLGEVRQENLERLELHRLASDLREAFWGFAQAGISRLDFDFNGYAAKHLGRFLRGAISFYGRPS